MQLLTDSFEWQYCASSFWNHARHRCQLLWRIIHCSRLRQTRLRIQKREILISWNCSLKPKSNKTKRGRPFSPFRFQITLAQLCKNIHACLCEHPNTSIVRGRNWSMGCQSQYFFSLAWATSKVINLSVVQDWGNKSACIGSIMAMSAKVQIPSLVNTMSSC